MRHRLALLTAASLLASAATFAQTPAAGKPPQTPSAPAGAATSGLSGVVDIGGQVTAVDGDEARFERYRDSRNGVYSTLLLNRDTDSSLFGARVFHAGYRDQRYNANYIGPRLNITGDWTSVPLNFSYLTRTPYTTNGSVLTLPDSAQLAVQSK